MTLKKNAEQRTTLETSRCFLLLGFCVPKDSHRACFGPGIRAPPAACLFGMQSIRYMCMFCFFQTNATSPMQFMAANLPEYVSSYDSHQRGPKSGSASNSNGSRPRAWFAIAASRLRPCKALRITSFSNKRLLRQSGQEHSEANSML